MSEQNNKMENISKSSNVAMILARIVKIFFIVGTGVCVIAGIGLIAFSGTVDAELFRAEAEGKLNLEELIMEFNVGGFTLSYDDLGHVSQTMGLNLLIEGAILIVYVVLMHFVGRVFQKIKESDSPFRKAILKNMIVVFVLITLLVLQSSILTGVMVGFSLWCVYCVFEYGCELQQLSDETL